MFDPKNAMLVLESLMASPGTVADVASRTGLPQVPVSRVLVALDASGLAVCKQDVWHATAYALKAWVDAVGVRSLFPYPVDLTTRYIVELGKGRYYWSGSWRTPELCRLVKTTRLQTAKTLKDFDTAMSLVEAMRPTCPRARVLVQEVRAVSVFRV